VKYCLPPCQHCGRVEGIARALSGLDYSSTARRSWKEGCLVLIGLQITPRAVGGFYNSGFWQSTGKKAVAEKFDGWLTTVAVVSKHRNGTKV
jgi:hypothetical protein